MRILDYPCGVIDSLKYGIPLAMVSFGAIWLQSEYFASYSALWRWTLISGLGCFLIVSSLKHQNRAFFPFRFGFLSAFNALVLATLVTGLLIFVFKDALFLQRPDGVSMTHWALSWIFLESMGFLFVSILLAAYFSWILRIK
ncbi:MAG: hypothetical protein RLP15_13250 [Cryomorphaceae bacterium]